MGDERLLAVYQEKINEGLAGSEENLNYWQAQTPEGMLSKDRENPVFRALENIAEITGLPVEDTVNHSYGLVIDREHELFGKVGIFINNVGSFPLTNAYKFGGKKVCLSENQAYHSRNVQMILDERKRILNSSLFEASN